MDLRESWLEKEAQGKSRRDKDLLDRASRTLMGNVLPGTQENWDGYRGIVPSVSTYQGVWNWDAAFHTVGVSRWDARLAYDQCEIIWNTQLEDGQFCDSWRYAGNIDYGICKPPVFPWAFVQAYKRSPDRTMLEKAYKKYSHNYDFWVNKRSENGLFYYYSAQNGAWAKLESGWDTSVRFDDFGAENLFAIDLNCYMVTMLRALSFMAAELGNGEEKGWQQKETALSDRIEENFWNEELGIYTDILRNNRQSTGVISPAGFMPLFIGTASPERAKKCALVASDPEKLFPAMPTVSFDHPRFDKADYWRGPAWVNTSYFAIKGLKDYGFAELAFTLKENLLNWIDADKEAIFEYYDARTGKGLGAPHYGWSATFTMEFILNF